jgi:predicted RNA-binding Zn ribbon-like protein
MVSLHSVDESRSFRFELSGGRLCLDFANTVDERPRAEPRDHLQSYADLLSWSRQADLLSPRRAIALQERARSRPEAARRALTRAKALREALFEIFAAVARGSSPSSRARSVLESALRTAYASPALTSRGPRFGLDFEDDPEALDGMLGPVTRSAAVLLTSPEIDRIRVCAASDCDWLFFDETRNRSRQWCDMTVCGNRAKARRFQARKKRGG